MLRESGTTVSALDIASEVHGRPVVIIDDMITTGATIEAAVRLLRLGGAAADIVVAATHGLLVHAAASRLRDLDLRRTLVTDTVAPKDWGPRSRCAPSRRCWLRPSPACTATSHYTNQMCGDRPESGAPAACASRRQFAHPTVGAQPWHTGCAILSGATPMKRPQRALTGKPPTWFRPGTAYYDVVAVAIVNELGERPLGFRVDADNGAKASAAQVRSKITGAAPGSVMLADMNHPESGTAAGVSDAITALRASGCEFVSVNGQIVQ